jgi:predicted phosphoribosyltransferase
LLLVRKIGVPFQPELAMGAVVDGDRPTIVRNTDVIEAIGIPHGEFETVVRRELQEIERRRALYLGGRPPVEVAGKTAIVVDDGIATGATVRAALRSVRERGPKRLVLAVPVAAADTLAALRGEVDDLVCLEAHDDFGAIGSYYANFDQVADDEVIRLLDAAQVGLKASPMARAARGGAK